MCNNLVIESEAMRDVQRLFEKVARRPTTVLLTGETGVGKNRIAEAIHKKSSRKKILYLNCAEIHENLIESTLFGHVAGAYTDATKSRIGFFEDADWGTLFIDEVGDLSPAMQMKFLRVLETGEFTRMGGNKTRKVNVRVIAATNKNLEDMVKEGSFREDLYYRLKISSIHIPPLRDRRDEIKPLVLAFIDEIDKEFKAEDVSEKNAKNIGEEALKFLESKSHRWVGNVRELRSTVETAMVWATGDELKRTDFETAMDGSQALSDTLFEKLMSERGISRADIVETYIEASEKGKGRGPNDYLRFEYTMGELLRGELDRDELAGMKEPEKQGYVGIGTIDTFTKKCGQLFFGEICTTTEFINKAIEAIKQKENDMADKASENENEPL